MIRTILSLLLALNVFALNVSVRCAAATETPPIDEVVLVFKTHFDIGYTKLASEVIEHYRTTMIDNALTVVDASKGMPDDKQFIWTLPGYPMAAILKDQTPQRAARLDHALRTGRFALHALPFTLHTETLVEEDLVRGLRYSTHLSKQYGLPLPTDAKMTDVPCHSWILPTLLAHAGITFMHEGTNSGSGDPEVPLLFFREGPDGSRVLTMHVDGYGSGLEPPEDWQYRTWLWLIHTGDNHGPPRPQEVEEYLKEAVQRFPDAKIYIGRLSDFGNAILEKEDATKIPVVKGDMPDTWIHGPMCDPQGQRLARAAHEMIVYQEMFETLYGQPQTQAIADAWEQSLLYGEHTWGGSLYWLHKYGAEKELPFGEEWKALEYGKNFNPAYRRSVASWEEKSDYIRRAIQGHELDKPRTVLFNPLPWDLVDYRGRTLAPGAVASHFSRAASEGGTPPKLAGSSVSEKTTIATEHFALTVDPKTNEISLLDLKHGREVFRQGYIPGFFYHRADAETCDKFLNDYCISFPAGGLSEFTKRGLPRDEPERRMKFDKIKRVEMIQSVVQDSKQIRIEFEPDEEFSLTAAMNIELYEKRPEVRFAFTGTKIADSWPEAGYFHFPLAIENPQFRLGRLGGIVDPAVEIVRGSNRHFQWLRTGVAVFGEDGYGIGICPLDSPLVSLDKPGGWLFSKDFVPKRPDVWFNLFNNQWNTNFRLWNEGDLHASFILWTFDRYDNERSLITPSLEAFALNFQPVYAQTPSESVQGIRIDRKGIYVTAFGKDPDSGALMLRMWEMAGQGADAPPVTVQLPATLSVESVLPCDLRGRPIGEAIPVVDGKFKIEVKPYTPVSLLLL
jgi:hypothetical protein